MKKHLRKQVLFQLNLPLRASEIPLMRSEIASQ